MNKQINENILIIILEYAITKEINIFMCINRAWKKACESQIIQCQYKFLKVFMPICSKHLEDGNYIAIYRLLYDLIKNNNDHNFKKFWNKIIEELLDNDQHVDIKIDSWIRNHNENHNLICYYFNIGKSLHLVQKYSLSLRFYNKSLDIFNKNEDNKELRKKIRKNIKSILKTNCETEDDLWKITWTNNENDGKFVNVTEESIFNENFIFPPTQYCDLFLNTNEKIFLKSSHVIVSLLYENQEAWLECNTDETWYSRYLFIKKGFVPESIYCFDKHVVRRAQMFLYETYILHRNPEHVFYHKDRKYFRKFTRHKSCPNFIEQFF